MDSRRLEGLGSVRQYASRSRFLSDIKGKYRLPKAVNAIGLRSKTARGIIRRGRSLRLVYAANPANKRHRSIKCINNLNISVSLALSWPSNALSQIGDETTLRSAKSKLFLGAATDPGHGRLNGSAICPIRYISKSNDKGYGRLELSGSDDMIVQGEPVDSEVGIREPGPLSLTRGRKPFWQTGYMMPNLVVNPASFKSSVHGLASQWMTNSNALAKDMTSIKYIQSLKFSPEISEKDFGRFLSFRATKTRAVTNPASDEVFESRHAVFKPVYRTVRAVEAPMQSLAEGEEKSFISSRESKVIAEPVHLAPSAQDLNRISDQVCSIIERRLLTERERRGIHG